MLGRAGRLAVRESAMIQSWHGEPRLDATVIARTRRRGMSRRRRTGEMATSRAAFRLTGRTCRIGFQ